VQTKIGFLDGFFVTENPEKTTILFFIRSHFRHNPHTKFPAEGGTARLPHTSLHQESSLSDLPQQVKQLFARDT
jgi:hypothetical protein